ncbi:MAG: phage major capsid protein [Nitrosomonas sp.]|nr:phage major capsid protein [Nitrosomonas sp.]
MPQSTVGRVVSKIYEQSTMRKIANVKNISTEKLEGPIDNNEADAGWVSELSEPEAILQLRKSANTRLETYELYAMPKIGQKLIDDAAMNVEGMASCKSGG